MKKILFMASILTLCIVAIYIKNIIETNNEIKVLDVETNTGEISNMDDLTYIKESINTIIQSKEYKAAEIDIKVKLLQPVLDKLIEDGYVLEYQYNPKEL